MGRAAQRLNLAQSALSKQIQDLEREVGSPLFERLPRGIALSEAGRVFLTHARETLARADLGLRAVRSAAAGESGSLRIGTPDWGDRTQQVASAARRFRAERPSAALHFDSTPWTLHLDALRERRIDVGFGLSAHAGDFGEDIAAELLAAEPARSAVLPGSHPLARQESVSLDELRELPFVYFERSLFPPLYDAATSALRDAGYRPTKTLLALPSFAAAAQVVASGGGWTYVVDSVAALPPPGTVVRRISNVMRDLAFFALSRRDDPNLLIPTFIECLRGARDVQSSGAT